MRCRKMKKEIKKTIREFMWKEGRARVKWDVLIRPEEEGGIDPECDLDAAKVRIIKDMMMKADQPWVKWVERKLQKLKERWGGKYI